MPLGLWHTCGTYQHQEPVKFPAAPCIYAALRILLAVSRTSCKHWEPLVVVLPGELWCIALMSHLCCTPLLWLHNVLPAQSLVR